MSRIKYTCVFLVSIGIIYLLTIWMNQTINGEYLMFPVKFHDYDKTNAMLQESYTLKWNTLCRLNSCSRDSTSASDIYKMQRDEVSRLLNEARKTTGQFSCKANSAKDSSISESGGWCRSTSQEDSTAHMTDKTLSAALAELFTGQSVASFGDGPGVYKRLLMKTGLPTTYDAYDGAPYSEENSKGEVRFLDLSVPQYGLPIYDWALSLEVAEHIPQQYEQIYLENVIRHVKKGIVLSWAVVYQRGVGHVNNRPIEYVIDKMLSYGFKHDIKASKKLRKQSTFKWFQNNIQVFRRTNRTSPFV